MRCAIYIRDEGIKPDDPRSELRARSIAGCEVKHDGSGQIVESEIQPGTCTQKVANLFVGFIAAESSIDIYEHDLWHIQTQNASDLAGDEFGRERQRALSGSAELD